MAIERIGILCSRKSKFKDNAYLNFGNGANANDPAAYDVRMYFDGTSFMLENPVASASSSRALYVEQTITCTTAGVRQGAVYIEAARAATSPLASWDGNPDCALKVQITNYANNGSNGGTRGLDILARNRDSTGNQSWVNGAYITAEHRTGSGTLATDVIGLEVHPKNNSVCSGNVKGLRVYDESQSATGTTYGIELNCTGDSGFAREYGIYIGAGTTASWTNGLSFNDTITNPLDFEDVDGTNGATYDAAYTFLDSSCVGKIRVDVGGNTCYIPLYSGVS